MEILTTIKAEIQKANSVGRLEIKQADMGVLTSVEKMFTRFQSYMLKSQAENSQNQDTTPSSSQKTTIT